MSADKDKKVEKFKAAQDAMRALCLKIPAAWSSWDYAKTVHYKKVTKDCDKFLKLKPSDDDKAFIRMDNQLSELKRFY